MDKKKNLSGRLERMVRHPKAPSSLEDFLNEQQRPLDVTNEPNYKELTDNNISYKREEFRFPILLAEKLRQASYKLNKKKTDIVQDALTEYLAKIDG